MRQNKKIIPVTESRNRLFEIIDEVQRSETYYILTEHGRPKAVIMSFEEFESFEETVDLLWEHAPDLRKSLHEAEEEYKKGEYVSLEEFMGQQGYVLADKAKQKYDASGRRPQRGAKTSRKTP